MFKEIIARLSPRVNLKINRCGGLLEEKCGKSGERHQNLSKKDLLALYLDKLVFSRAYTESLCRLKGVYSAAALDALYKVGLSGV